MTQNSGCKDQENMKKYIVYRYMDNFPEGMCPHMMTEFDDITKAVNFFNLQPEKIKHILTYVTWKTTVEDVTGQVE